MQDLNRNSGAELEKSMSNKVWLQVVEYVVAGLATAGTVATLVAKEMAAAAAIPLTASVFLNLLNRRHLDQLTRQRTFADTTEVQRRLSAEVQSLRSQVESLPAFQERSDYNDVKVSLTSLSESVSTLERQMMDIPAEQSLATVTTLEEEINQLREYQIDLTHSLEALQNQVASESEAVTFSESIHQELAALQEAVAQFSQPTPEPMGQVPDLEPLRAELQGMLTPVQQQVADLLARLEHQQASPIGVPSQEEQLTPLYSQIEEVKVSMDTMLANLSEEMQLARGAMENTQHQVNEVQQQLSVVREEAIHTPAGLNPEGFNQQLQAALEPLQGQMEQLAGRINAIPMVDSIVTQRQDEQLQELQHQLHELRIRLEEVSSQFAAEMANLPHRVDEQVQHCVGEMQKPTAPQGDEMDKQEKLSELDSLLADLS
jgi:chromosome segregation ATPase